MFLMTNWSLRLPVLCFDQGQWCQSYQKVRLLGWVWVWNFWYFSCFLGFFWKYNMLWNLIRYTSFGGISNGSQHKFYRKKSLYSFLKIWGSNHSGSLFCVWTKLRGVTTQVLYTVYSTPFVLRCLLFSVFTIKLNYITQTMGILTSLDREIYRNVRNSEA